MARQSDLRACGFSRRGFFGLASTAAGLFIREAWAGSRERRLLGGDPALLSPLEREHFPSPSLPARTRNGAKVPIVVEMRHPMTPQHHVTRPDVGSERDPRRGEVIHPQLKIRHPTRTGLAEHDGSFVRASEPLYLEKMEVWFGGEAVSKFELTPALSDDPFITFALLASREGSLEVRLVNNRGQRFETAHEISFS